MQKYEIEGIIWTRWIVKGPKLMRKIGGGSKFAKQEVYKLGVQFNVEK